MARREPVCEPVGLKEMAERLGVAQGTAWQWKKRGVLPEPDFPSVHGRAAWNWPTILKWAGRRGSIHCEEGVKAFVDMFDDLPHYARLGGPIPPE